MASFSLQVFLLLSAPFRRRHGSRLLNGSLWVAYLMADYGATYVLGRLTLLLTAAGVTAPRHQLALFWAPFLLLHLGGQETITALSMEDNTLWMRRLLDLVAQVAMSVYVVGKQWQGDRLLVAPMHGARVRVGSSQNILAAWLVLRASWRRPPWISKQAWIFFMDVSPSDLGGSYVPWFYHIKDLLVKIKPSENGYEMVYKLAEMQVSLIYDYLYTKFGTVRFQASPKSKSNPTMAAALQWLVSLGLTSVALVLFAVAMAGNTTSSNFEYSGSDVLISYILLVGAIAMEISSIFIALTSSCWAGIAVVKHIHLHVGEWSGQWALWVANRVDSGYSDPDSVHPVHPAHRALSASMIRELDFVSNVVVWRLVTTICLLAGDGGPSELTNPSKDLSSYIMYLVVKRRVMVDSDGHIVIARSRSEVDDFLIDELHQDGFIQKLRQGIRNKHVGYGTATPTELARMACVELLNIPGGGDRWELIAAVWTEILCYMALNCGATFHAKHLTTGGEFLTQAKMLLFQIRVPFLINNINIKRDVIIRPRFM
uniref:DUF4220 domain-containing protein n=1 Tax=Oryza punctata TaxID=4537 RepID=A0A0E0MH61_ORYPU